MAEARAAASEPKVKFHDEGTSEIEQETKVAKSVFQDLKLCAFRTKWVNISFTFVCYKCSIKSLSLGNMAGKHPGNWGKEVCFIYFHLLKNAYKEKMHLFVT